MLGIRNANEIFLYDNIGFDELTWTGIRAIDLINEIKEQDFSEIILRINSSGGDIFEAQAMYNYLKNSSAKVKVIIDGLAASAASIVAMCGDIVIMPENALLMIHNPSGALFGDSADFQDMAGVLEKISDSMAGIYSEKTGLEKIKIREFMNAETWFSAREAFEYKFIDSIGEPVEISANANGLLKNKYGSALINKLPEKFKNNYYSQAVNNKNKNEKLKPEKLKAEYDAGIKAERERLKELDDLNAPGRENLIYEAKYKTFENAKDIAINLLKLENIQARKVESENLESALNNIGGISNKSRSENFQALILNKMKKIRGVKN